jgi:hypothetical protein
MSAAFGFVPLAWSLQLVIVAVLAAYVVANEVTKRFFYARGG